MRNEVASNRFGCKIESLPSLALLNQTDVLFTNVHHLWTGRTKIREVVRYQDPIHSGILRDSVLIVIRVLLLNPEVSLALRAMVNVVDSPHETRVIEIRIEIRRFRNSRSKNYPSRQVSVWISSELVKENRTHEGTGGLPKLNRRGEKRSPGRPLKSSQI